MELSYDYYRCFYYVAKYQNMTQAAAAMMSSQPNMTRIIHNLEHELGCRLMVRSNRGITLTEEGERLYRHVAAAFEQIRQGEEELTGSGSVRSGSVQIGTSETVLHMFLLDVLTRFHREYPAIRLKVRNYSTLKAVQALRAGQIDFAVVTTPVGPLPAGFQRTDLRRFRDILMGGRQFSALADRPLRLAELKQYPLISLSRDTRTFAFYREIYEAQGQELEPDIEVATTDLILPMIERNLGIGFLPENFAREALQRGSALELKLEETIPERHISLLRDTRSALNPAPRVLADLLQEEAERPFHG